MVGMRNETIISMRFVRSKLRKREESSHVVNEATQPTHVVASVEPVGFRQSPSSVWHFPPLPPQPNLYIYNASSQVSKTFFIHSTPADRHEHEILITSVNSVNSGFTTHSILAFELIAVRDKIVKKKTLLILPF